MFKEQVYQKFVNDFSIVLRNKIEGLEISKLIFLCIGTDRIIGDSFGPLVGYKLKNFFSKNDNIEVIGDLERIVSLSNIENIISNIYNTYENPFVVAIDSAVYNKNRIGAIIVTNTKINVAGMYTNRKILVGDISIKGVVSRDLKNIENNLRLLQNLPLSLIMNMADTVAQGIFNVINV